MDRSVTPPDPSLTPWPQYAEAVVELVIDGEHLVVSPTRGHGAETDEGRGADGGVGSLARLGSPVWVLTAGDPYPLELDAEENAARNAQLRREIEALGLRHDPALGRASDGSVWEVSIAVRGAARADVLALAARHGQLAVYELDDRIRCIDVASGAVVSSLAFRLESAPEGDDTLVGPTGWRG